MQNKLTIIPVIWPAGQENAILFKIFFSRRGKMRRRGLVHERPTSLSSTLTFSRMISMSLSGSVSFPSVDPTLAAWVTPPGFQTYTTISLSGCGLEERDVTMRINVDKE